MLSPTGGRLRAALGQKVPLIQTEAELTKTRQGIYLDDVWSSVHTIRQKHASEGTFCKVPRMNIHPNPILLNPMFLNDLKNIASLPKFFQKLLYFLNTPNTRWA